jgi:type II secretory pathway component PulF
MIFKYKGIDSKGKKVKDKIEAISIDEAKAKLKAKGIIYQKIEEEKTSFLKNFNFSIKYKIPPKELAALSRELSMYLRSGISIVSAIKIISSHYKSNKKIELFLTTISTYLDEGKDFYTALQMQGVVSLPEFYKESIKVSENGGILDEALMELSRFLKEQDKIKKEITSAFAYPSFMIVVSFAMIIFMLTFVVPQITSIFKSMDQKLPDSTLFVIAMGNFFSNNFQLILISIFIIVALFVILRKKVYTFAYFIDKIILKIPIFGDIVMKSELARFSYMASLLIRSGVPLCHL